MNKEAGRQRNPNRRKNWLRYWCILPLLYIMATAVVHKDSQRCDWASAGLDFSASHVEAVVPTMEAAPINREAYHSFSLLIQTENEQDIAQFFSFSNPFQPMFQAFRVASKLESRAGIIIPNLDIRTIIFPFHSFL